MTEPIPAAGEPVAPDIFEGYLTEEQYAAQRGVSLRTCQRDRQLRQSPPYTVVGKKVLYRRESVRQWLLDQERQVDRHMREHLEHLSQTPVWTLRDAG